MPLLGLGTWQLTRDTAATVEAALKLGYRMIDTSGDYGTQPGIGQAVRRSGIARDRVYIVTKVEEIGDAYGGTREDLAELEMDYADLMLIHRPPPTGVGRRLWEGLIRAKREGLARDIGVSNYTEKQIETLADATGEMPVVNQIEWSPFGHSDKMATFARHHGIILQAYSPLTHGKRVRDAGLRALASKYGKTPAQLLLRWNLQRGTVPLPKANQRTHLEENIDIFDFEIDSRDMKALGGFNEHYSSLGVLAYA